MRCPSKSSPSPLNEESVTVAKYTKVCELISHALWGKQRKAYQKIPTSTESFRYALRLARAQKKGTTVETAAIAGITPAGLERIKNQTIQPIADELSGLRQLFPRKFVYWKQSPNSCPQVGLCTSGGSGSTQYHPFFMAQLAVPVQPAPHRQETTP